MKTILAGVLLAAAAPALAQADDGPRFCPTRPSLGESGCTTEPGHVHVEASAVDWTKDDTAATREDTVLVGDFQLRIGLTDDSELQVAWTPYGHDRVRDKGTGLIDSVARVGDVRIGLRQNLHHPDGKGLSFAIEPSVTLPVGGQPIGAGTWGAGLVVPVTYDLSDTFNVQLTNDVEAAPDEDGEGRHVLINEIVGLSTALTKQLTFTTELQVTRDDDPAGHETRAVAAGSFAWQPRKHLQLDALVGVGLNRATPDLEVLTGGAVEF